MKIEVIGHHHIELMSHNADVLWNSSDKANFNVDKQGRLSTISKWNLLGRLIKWIKNYKGDVTDRISQAIQETLSTIVKTNKKGRVYVRDQRKGFEAFFVNVKKLYSPYYPASFLAEKVIKNPQFNNNQKIREIGTDLFFQGSSYPSPNSNFKRVLNCQQFEYYKKKVQAEVINSTLIGNFQ